MIAGDIGDVDDKLVVDAVAIGGKGIGNEDIIVAGDFYEVTFYGSDGTGIVLKRGKFD